MNGNRQLQKATYSLQGMPLLLYSLHISCSKMMTTKQFKLFFLGRLLFWEGQHLFPSFF